MECEIAVVVEFGVGPLLETVAEDDDTAAGRDLQVELNMPMTEDIVVAVVVLFCFSWSLAKSTSSSLLSPLYGQGFSSSLRRLRFAHS